MKANGGKAQIVALRRVLISKCVLLFRVCSLLLILSCFASQLHPSCAQQANDQAHPPPEAGATGACDQSAGCRRSGAALCSAAVDEYGPLDFIDEIVVL